jgi:hypothetical protein
MPSKSVSATMVINHSKKGNSKAIDFRSDPEFYFILPELASFSVIGVSIGQTHHLGARESITRRREMG